ncbi:hypothetical protein V6Z96_002948, partial [Aspergillus fumigatus]
TLYLNGYFRSSAEYKPNPANESASHRPINQKSAQSDFNYGIFRRLIAQDTIEQMADFSVLNHKLRHSGTYQPAVRTRRCNPLSSARITPLASRMRAIVQDAYS